MKNLIEDYLQRHRASYWGNTERGYRSQAGQFAKHFAGRKLESITVADIADWANAMRKSGIRVSTLKQRVKIAKYLLDFAVTEKLIPSNPIRSPGLPRFKEQKVDRVPFTEEEFRRAYSESLNADRYPAWAGGAIMVGWHTGIRISDVADLEWQKCIGFSERLVRVWPNKKANVEEKLIIPMSDELFNYLLAAYNNREDERPHVFPRLEYLYREESQRVREAFRKIFDTVGLPDHSFHSFRHGFVTRLLNNQVDAIIIASMTGHTLQQVLAYSHVSISAKINALNKGNNMQPRGTAVGEF